jgi:putative SOS response-associated peptidase YedK
MWCEPFKRRRCLIPADVLYKWPLPGKAIDPYETPAVEAPLFPGIEALRPKVKAPRPVKRVFAISMTDDRPFAFAGLWDKWKDTAGNLLESYTLVTTEPNEHLASIHDRFALILKPEDYDRWLTTDD